MYCSMSSLKKNFMFCALGGYIVLPNCSKVSVASTRNYFAYATLDTMDV